jgi:hypothetical protein
VSKFVTGKAVLVEHGQFSAGFFYQCQIALGATNIAGQNHFSFF